MLLADVFAVQAATALGVAEFGGFGDTARQTLMEHAWPGNVRELRNVVERSVFEAAAGDTPVNHIIIDPFDSPYRPGHGPTGPDREQAPAGMDELPPGGFRAGVAGYERRVLDRALAISHHNQAAAARRLELDYHQFRRLLKRHGMQP